MKKYWYLFLTIVLPVIGFTQVDFEKFNKGYYINNQGQRIEGFIRYVTGSNARLEFELPNDRSRKKIYASDCREFGYIFDRNTKFIRCPFPISINTGMWGKRITSDFVQVIEEGNISLFKHYSSNDNNPQYRYHQGPYRTENVLILKAGDDELIVLSTGKKKVRKRLQEIFPDEPNVVEALSKDDWLIQLNFVREYNEAGLSNQRVERSLQTNK